MSFWDDDIDEFFLDFTVPVTVHSGETGEYIFNAIFDEAQKIYDVDSGQIVSTNPQLTCKSVDIINKIDRNVTVEINSVTYYVREIMDDGTGITVLTISENR